MATNYSYGEDGLRVKKATPTLTTYYVDKYTEVRGTDVIRHIYHGNDLVASIDENDDVVYTHKDHLGSGNIRTNASGTQVTRLEYFPFGEKRLNTGSSSFVKQRYTGQVDDEESGPYYYKQRYYDSKVGRFVSADPLYAEEMDERGTDSQEVNLYAYVGNNPYKFVDLDGLVSYLVSRNLSIPILGEFAEYMYIAVVNDKNKSDVQIYSYGELENGQLGLINNRKGGILATHVDDVKSFSNKTYTDIQTISAPDQVVRETARNFKTSADYSNNPFNIRNSNTASQAVANTSQGSKVRTPEDTWVGSYGHGNTDALTGAGEVSSSGGGIPGGGNAGLQK